MSHVAVILTSQQCGHCRNMRGDGVLLSKDKIRNRQPNIPGGYYYDSSFMKRLITAGMNKDAKLRVVNLHYKTFKPTDGFTDISIFTLENDNTVRQTFLREVNGKTNLTIYLLSDTTKEISNQNIETSWAEITKTYVPNNIANYAYFFPSLMIFESNEWTTSLKNNLPVFGYLNGFPAKEEAPYGVITGGNPDVKEFGDFLKQFFDGTKELKGKPSGSKPVPKPPSPKPVEEVVIPTTGSVKQEAMVIVPTAGAAKKRNYRLFVVE